MTLRLEKYNPRLESRVYTFCFDDRYIILQITAKVDNERQNSLKIWTTKKPFEKNANNLHIAFLSVHSLLRTRGENSPNPPPLPSVRHAGKMCFIEGLREFQLFLMTIGNAFPSHSGMPLRISWLPPSFFPTFWLNFWKLVVVKILCLEFQALLINDPEKCVFFRMIWISLQKSWFRHDFLRNLWVLILEAYAWSSNFLVLYWSFNPLPQMVITEVVKVDLFYYEIFNEELCWNKVKYHQNVCLYLFARFIRRTWFNQIQPSPKISLKIVWNL